MDEAQASLIREELSLRWKRIQFLEAENTKLKERGVKHHAEAAKFLATQAALKEQVKILKAENAKLKGRLFNIAETYRLYTSCVNTDWAKVALIMSHIAKE